MWSSGSFRKLLKNLNISTLQHYNNINKKQIYKILQFLSTNKMKKQKETDEKKKSENWKCWDESNKMRENLKWL